MSRGKEVESPNSLMLSLYSADSMSRWLEDRASCLLLISSSAARSSTSCSSAHSLKISTSPNYLIRVGWGGGRGRGGLGWD